MLCEVHAAAWKQWQRLHSDYPAELSLGGKEPQVPGQVPGHIFEAVQGKIDELGPKTKYARKV